MTILKNVKKYKTEGSRAYIGKINLLQEKLIGDPRISSRKNALDISKTTFN